MPHAIEPHRSRPVVNRNRCFGAAVASIAGVGWGWVPVERLPIPPVAAHAALVLVAVALFVAAIRAVADHAGPAVPIDRRLMWASIAGEVAAIPAGIALVAAIGRPDLAMPVIGLVVGAHFLPLARAFRHPPYRVLGVAIMLFALVPLTVPGPDGLAILGGGISASLLLTSLHATLRLRRRAGARVGAALLRSA